LTVLPFSAGATNNCYYCRKISFKLFL